MKKELSVPLVVILALMAGSPLRAQFTPEEIAERPKWEAFLASAEVIGQKQLGGENAVTSPWEITLQEGELRRKALWKNPQGFMGGYLEGWHYEIAAYRLDKLLGLDMVPPTIEKRFRGDPGACQLWVDDVINLRDKAKAGLPVPPAKVFSWDRAVYLQRAFDDLIGNEDRNEGDVLVTRDWRMILIDHSRTFRTSRKFTRHLIFSGSNASDPKPMKELPHAFVDRIRALDEEMIRTAAGDCLTRSEIEGVLARRALLLAEIDAEIARRGEASVLY
jgi:hypothetical protein